jgi:WD40 repeat protein
MTRAARLPGTLGKFQTFREGLAPAKLGLPHAFALLLLTAAGGFACRGQTDLLTKRDGGPGAGGAAGSSAGGSGGTTLPGGLNLDAPCDWRGAGGVDLAFTPDGALLLVASGGYVRAFDAATGRHVFITRWHPASLFGVATSPDGRWFATFSPGSGSSEFKGGVAVWQTGDPGQGKMLVMGEGVRAIGFSEDSSMLAVSFPFGELRPMAGRIVIFDLGTLSMVASVNQVDLGSSSALTISQDGYRLTYQNSKTFVVSSGTRWFGAQTSPGTMIGNAFDWAPASNIAVEIGSSEIWVNYQIPGLSPSALWSAETAAFSAVGLSHDGFRLAAGHADGGVSLWQLAPAPFEPHTMLLPAFTNQVAAITALAFSHDDSRVATASEDGTIYVRRVSDGSPLWHAEGPTPSLYGLPILAVSPSQGQLLALSAAISPHFARPVSLPARGYVMDLARDVVRGVLDPGPNAWGGISTGHCSGSTDATALVCPDELLTYSALDGNQVTTGTVRAGGRGGAALAPDRTRVVESTFPGGLWSWPLPGGAPREQFTLLPFNGVADRLVFSADGSTLAGVTSGAGVVPIRAWDARSGALLGEWSMTLQGAVETFLHDVAISRSGDLVAVVGRESLDVALVSPRSGTLQWVTPTTGENNAGFWAVSLSPDGTRVAVTSHYVGSPRDGVVTRAVTVFGSDGSPVARIAGYNDFAAFPTAFLDNQTLLRGERDGIVSVWCLP